MSRLSSLKPGDVYGDLVVIERAGSTPRGAATFRCYCRVCGSETIKEAQKLTDKKCPAVNCGCVYRQRTRDITGEVHGGVIVLGRSTRRVAKSGDALYRVQCRLCGNIREEMPKCQILTNPKSCGCLPPDNERMARMSPLGTEVVIVNGVNVYAVYRKEANVNSKTGVRGVFPERRHGKLTGKFRAAVKVHGKYVVGTGFDTVEAAKTWLDERKEELIKEFNVKDTRRIKK